MLDLSKSVIKSNLRYN